MWAGCSRRMKPQLLQVFPLPNHADLETVKQPGGNINIRYYSHKDFKVCIL